jgi:hypothetical protein
MNISSIANNISKFVRTTPNMNLQRLDKSIPSAVQAFETFENSNGEKLILEYSNGILKNAKKILPNGQIEYEKKYATKVCDGASFHVVETFRRNQTGNLSLSAILETSKETIAHYLDKNGKLDKYFRKFGDIWTRLDDKVDKSSRIVSDPERLYVYLGIQINKFLRNGKFNNSRLPKGFPTEAELNAMPENFRPIVEDIVKDEKLTNRKILDGISLIDEMTHSSVTTEPMIVNRRTKTKWINSAKDGVLTDRAFLSTSITEGASSEGLFSADPTVNYKIEIPVGTPYCDLSSYGEQELLFPRDGIFKIIEGYKLKLIGFLIHK